MAETFNKKEREKKREQKRKEKLSKKEARKESSVGGDLDSMMAYVDENGMISDTPPDPKDRKEVKAKNIEIGIPRRENEQFDPRISGTINFYDDTKGYGFIKSNGGEDFFVHLNNISGQPTKGKKVTFEKEKGPKGWIAVRVTVE